jgi:hypothetical protein
MYYIMLLAAHMTYVCGILYRLLCENRPRCSRKAIDDKFSEHKLLRESVRNFYVYLLLLA